MQKRSISNHYYLTLLLILFLFGQLSGKTVSVRILQTTDIHCHIESSGAKNEEGGWLRLATLVKQHRTQVGRQNTLLIDCGDTIQGSLSALVSKGEAAIDMLNYLQYDFWVPGNHELDFGTTRLEQLLEKTKVKVLNGNFILNEKKRRNFPAWKIVQKGGARICVIGMQASFLKEWFIGQQFKNYEVQKALVVLHKEMPKILQQKPDMIILALHHGYRYNDKRGVNEVRQLAEAFPEIDLILGGHTHQYFPGKKVAGVYYSQAGFHASHLGVTNVVIDTESHRVLSMKSYLQRAPKELVKDQGAAEVFEKWRGQVKEFAESEICQLKEAISGGGTVGFNCMISATIASALQNAAQSDFAIHGRFNKYSLQGRVTEADLFKVVPYENNIFVLTLTEKQLLVLMQEQMKHFKKHSFNGPIGFSLELDKNKKLIRIHLGKKKKLYTLALNSRVAAGGGGRFPWLKQAISSGEIPSREIKVSSRELVRRYLKSLSARQ